MTFDKDGHISKKKKDPVFTQNRTSFRAWSNFQGGIQDLCDIKKQLLVAVSNDRKSQSASSDLPMIFICDYMR